MSKNLYNDYLMHHGVKGQKWGVRRYQYADGSLTPAGRARLIKTGKYYGPWNGKSSVRTRAADRVLKAYSNKIARDTEKTSEIGKRYIDTYLNTNTPLYRIQSSDKFENFAFYATYKDHDINEYAGLFGKNLKNRADYEARKAEREEKRSGIEGGAAELRAKADNMQIYQLKIANTSRLKVPSEDNASAIVGKLLRDKDFASNLKASIDDSASKMTRPSQQMLFKEAKKVMDKDLTSLPMSDKRTLYKALNLTLTNHNDQEKAMQDKFYGEMKKRGYSALLDLNDKQYSSYHAKSPVIVFDADKVKLQSVTNMDSSKVDKLYAKYNRERILKDIPEQVIGNIAKYSSLKYDTVSGYVDKRVNSYLNKH